MCRTWCELVCRWKAACWSVDQFLHDKGYPTRSEAIKALMRRSLAEKASNKDALVAGSITLVYDHHRGGIVKQLMDIQHDFGTLIVSTQHVHLDHHHCPDIIVAKGKALPFENC